MSPFRILFGTSVPPGPQFRIHDENPSIVLAVIVRVVGMLILSSPSRKITRVPQNEGEDLDKNELQRNTITLGKESRGLNLN